MVKPLQVDQANNAIEAFLRRSDAIIQCSDAAGREAARKLLETLVDADKSMERRLAYWVNRRGGGGDMLFSEASLIAYREQIQTAITMTQQRLMGITNAVSLKAARAGLALSNDLFNQLETAFTGVVRPIPLDRAAIMRLKPSLLTRHATSVDRYGTAMVNRMEKILSQGLAEGVSQYEMVQRLVGLRGPTGMVSLRAVEVQPGVVVRLTEEFIPEGLFVRHRMWPWRIVRTETAEAQNAANEASIDNAARHLGVPIKRKILAMMDNRTGMDSIAVHGQVRAKEENFVDGAGRRYLRPPARPNDRETIIPWRDHWENTRRTTPLTEDEQAAFIDEHAEWKKSVARRRARLERMRKKRIERLQKKRIEQQEARARKRGTLSR